GNVQCSQTGSSIILEANAMRKQDSKGENVRKELIKLDNTIHWDPNEGDKVYLKSVQVSIVPWPFDTRHALLRFSGGPALDFCVVDLDRLVLAYLKLRGVKPNRQDKNQVLGRSK